MNDNSFILGITKDDSNFNTIKKILKLNDFNNSYFDIVVSTAHEPPEIENIIDTSTTEHNIIKAICKLFYESKSLSLKYHEIAMSINTISNDDLKLLLDLMHDNGYLHFDDKKYIAYINTKVFDFYGFS